MECYLDNSATTKPCQRALEAAAAALSETWGNPSSLHRKGIEARELLESCRRAVARTLKSLPEEIVFTPCGTGANNTAIFGAVGALRRRGNRLVTTALEHPSVSVCMEKLEREGFEVVRIRPDADGNISERDFEAAIDARTILVSLMSVNNETGAVLPFDKIREIIEKKHAPALLHVDNVQGYLKLPVFPGELGIDLMSLSAHKIHGPKGIGALYVRRGVHIPPYIMGGGQERNICSGTQGVASVAAFAAAAEDFGDTKTNLRRVTELNRFMRAGLGDFDGVRFNSPEKTLPYILNLSLLGIPSQVTVNFLSMNGVFVSAGSACARGHRSGVLAAMGLPPERIDSAIRLSLSRFTTKEELKYCMEFIETALKTLRKK